MPSAVVPASGQGRRDRKRVVDGSGVSRVDRRQGQRHSDRGGKKTIVEPQVRTLLVQRSRSSAAWHRARIVPFLVSWFICGSLDRRTSAGGKSRLLVGARRAAVPCSGSALCHSAPRNARYAKALATDSTFARPSPNAQSRSTARRRRGASNCKKCRQVSFLRLKRAIRIRQFERILAVAPTA